MADKTETEVKKELFLLELMVDGNISAACERAGVHRPVMYDARNRSKVFREKWEKNRQIGLEALQDEAVRRASGWFEAREDGTEVFKYSDALLMFNLKAHFPEKYRDNYKSPDEDNDVGRPVYVEVRADGSLGPTVG